MVAVAAEPEAKARAYFACSRAATASSKFSLEGNQSYSYVLRSLGTHRFGLELRVYM